MNLQIFAPEMIEDRNPDSAVHYIINKTYGGAKFIIYENPQLRARPNDAPLGIKFYQRWARHENIAGAKYSGKDPGFFRELCSLRNSKFKVYLGNDSLIRDTIHQGVEADGIISGLASYKPQLFIDYQRDRKEAVLKEIEEFGRTLPSNGDVVQGLKNGFYAQGAIKSPGKVTR
jgi:dihydrodipicolinate synthase/N-acetylneuraminate lyase